MLCESVRGRERDRERDRERGFLACLSLAPPHPTNAHPHPHTHQLGEFKAAIKALVKEEAGKPGLVDDLKAFKDEFKAQAAAGKEGSAAADGELKAATDG